MTSTLEDKIEAKVSVLQEPVSQVEGPNRRLEGVDGSHKFDFKNRRAYVPITPDAPQNGEYQHRVAQNGYRR